METKRIADLIMKGSVYSGIEGNTPEEVYQTVVKMVPLPEYLTGDVLCAALVDRERLLSTAVGRGIALPHTRTPVVKSDDDEQICVIYLKNPIDMGAPDGLKVFVMFLLMTKSSQSHLDVLGHLVTLFRKPSFYSLLEKGADKDALVAEMNRLSASNG